VRASARTWRCVRVCLTRVCLRSCIKHARVAGTPPSALRSFAYEAGEGLLDAGASLALRCGVGGHGAMRSSRRIRRQRSTRGPGERLPRVRGVVRQQGGTGESAARRLLPAPAAPAGCPACGVGGSDVATYNPRHSPAACAHAPLRWSSRRRSFFLSFFRTPMRPSACAHGRGPGGPAGREAHERRVWLAPPGLL
jgi:hypothetical protein